MEYSFNQLSSIAKSLRERYPIGTRIKLISMGDDAWKARLTEEAHEYFNKDKRETRENVSIENLLETDLICDESIEEEYLRAEEERQALPKTMDVAMDILEILTPTQRSRYLKHKMYGMTTRAIAAEEGCSHKQVEKSIAQAQEKIAKEWEKRGY